jgi:hypothetical protein
MQWMKTNFGRIMVGKGVETPNQEMADIKEEVS